MIFEKAIIYSLYDPYCSYFKMEKQALKPPKPLDNFSNPFHLLPNPSLLQVPIIKPYIRFIGNLQKKVW